jgi:hypothetical protein
VEFGALGGSFVADTENAADKLVVFISYSRDDIEIADWLDVTLESNGFSPTLDRHGISGAEDWQQRLGGHDPRRRHFRSSLTP